MAEGKDNRNLLDETKNQKLTKDDIEVMKEDMSGKVRIQRLNKDYNIDLNFERKLLKG